MLSRVCSFRPAVPTPYSLRLWARQRRKVPELRSWTKLICSTLSGCSGCFGSPNEASIRLSGCWKSEVPAERPEGDISLAWIPFRWVSRHILGQGDGSRDVEGPWRYLREESVTSQTLLQKQLWRNSRRTIRRRSYFFNLPDSYEALVTALKDISENDLTLKTVNNDCWQRNPGSLIEGKKVNAVVGSKLVLFMANKTPAQVKRKRSSFVVLFRM